MSADNRQDSKDAHLWQTAAVCAAGHLCHERTLRARSNPEDAGAQTLRSRAFNRYARLKSLRGYDLVEEFRRFFTTDPERTRAMVETGRVLEDAASAEQREREEQDRRALAESFASWCGKDPAA